MHYIRARHYASQLGRFASVDPRHHVWHLYQYTPGNPATYVDPAGTHYERNVRYRLPPSDVWFTPWFPLSENDRLRRWAEGAVCLAKGLGGHAPPGDWCPIEDIYVADLDDGKAIPPYGYTVLNLLPWPHHHVFVHHSLFEWDPAWERPVGQSIGLAKDLGITILHEEWHYNNHGEARAKSEADTPVGDTYRRLNDKAYDFRPARCCKGHDGQPHCIMTRLEWLALCECRLRTPHDPWHEPPCATCWDRLPPQRKRP